MKTGIVFEGGAFRTIFSCGVMDALVENDIMPDYMINSRKGIVAWRKFYCSTSDRGRQDKKY